MLSLEPSKVQARTGPNLQIDDLQEEDIDWVFDALQHPENYEPLSMPRAPTREEIRDRVVYLRELGASQGEAQTVGFLAVRWRDTGAPHSFFLHYGWNFTRDPSREIDICVPDPSSNNVLLMLEAHALSLLFLLSSHGVKRVRFRVAHGADGALTWYERCGARAVGDVEEPHPVTKNLEKKRIYELSRMALEDLLKTAGTRLEAPDAGVAFMQDVCAKLGLRL